MRQTAAEGTAGRRKSRFIYFNFIGQFELAFSEEEIKAAQKEDVRQQREKKTRKKKAAKARYQNKKQERYDEREGHKFAKRICEHCGQEFWPGGPNTACCSPVCSKIFYRKNAKEKYEARKAAAATEPAAV